MSDVSLKDAQTKSLCYEETQTNSLCYEETQTNSLCYEETQTNSLCYKRAVCGSPIKVIRSKGVVHLIVH